MVRLGMLHVNEAKDLLSWSNSIGRSGWQGILMHTAVDDVLNRLPLALLSMI